jgi:hypothetical protein
LVDVRCTFNIIDVGEYRKSSDGGFLARLELGKSLEPGTHNPNSEPPPNSEELIRHVISEEAFPVKRDLFQPYCGVSVRNDENKQIYNHRLSGAH